MIYQFIHWVWTYYAPFVCLFCEPSCDLWILLSIELWWYVCVLLRSGAMKSSLFNLLVFAKCLKFCLLFALLLYYYNITIMLNICYRGSSILCLEFMINENITFVSSKHLQVVYELSFKLSLSLIFLLFSFYICFTFNLTTQPMILCIGYIGSRSHK
jgi:hypothetical protein